MGKGSGLLVFLKLGTALLLSLPLTMNFLWAGGEEHSMPGLEASIDYLSPSMSGKRYEAQKNFLQEREYLNQELEGFTSRLLTQTRARPDVVGPLLKEMRKDLEASPELKKCVQRVFPQFLQQTLQPHTILGELDNEFLVESHPSIDHPFLFHLKNVIKELESLEKEAFFQSEAWLTRFKTLREHYESYARSLCESEPKDRIHFLSGVALRTERLPQSYFISKETAYQILSMDTRGLITKSNGTGSSAVASFKDIHFKRNLLRKHLHNSEIPEGTLNPGMEWAMYAFYKLFGDGGIPPSSLIILEDVPQKEALPDTRAATLVEQASYPNLSERDRKEIMKELSFNNDRKKEFKETSCFYVLQASQTIEGPLIGKILQDAQKKKRTFASLDSKKTSALFVAGLLTNPADAKEDNFIVRNTGEGLHEIVSIDNDLSLASLIVQEQDIHLLEAKNVLYCLPEVRGQQLHKDIRKRIINLPVQVFLLEWLSLLKQQDKRYQRLLNEGVLTQEEYKTLYFPLRLTTNTLQEIEAKLIHLQGILRKSLVITHQEILEQMFPLVGLYYKTVLSQGKDSLSTFQRIYNYATSPSIEKICPLDHCLPDGHQVKKKLAQETALRGAYRHRTQTLDMSLEQFLKNLDLTPHTPQQKIGLLEAIINLFPTKASKINHENWRDKYLIHELIPYQPSLQLVEFLLNQVPESLKAQDDVDQKTLLHRIVVSHLDNHPETLDLVLSKGALLEAKDKRSLTPLDYAMDKQKEAFFTRLIQKGASQANSDIALKFYRTFSLTSESYKAFDTLTTHNPEIAWHIALEYILPPSGIGIEVQGATLGKRVLPAYLENQLFDKHGTLIRRNVTGRHHVGYIENGPLGRMYRLYFKQLPELPGLEEAVGLLTRQIMGGGAPFSELIRLNGKPVLVSYGIQGSTLTDIFKKHSHKVSNPPEFNQLDPTSLSAMILMAMLTNPEDGKPDNLVLEQLPLSLINLSAHTVYRMVSIDNDHAFVPAVAKERAPSFFRPEPIVQVKTILFSLDQMNDEVHPQVSGRIINLDVGEVLEQWVRELRKRHSLYHELFSEQKEILRYLEEENCYIGVPFRKGAIEELYQKIVRLQEDLASNPSITHFELLKKLEPALAYRYQQGFLKPMTVAQRFELIDGSFYRQDQQGHRQTITQSGDILRSMGIPLKEDLIDSIRKGGLQQANYQPEMALMALKQIRSQHGTLALMKQQASIDIVLKSLGELNLSDHRMALLENINFKSLSQPQQRAVFELLKGQDFRRLYLKEATALTDSYLTGLIPLNKVVSINLEGCSQVTQAAIVYIADQASLLEYLNVSGIDNLQGIFQPKIFGRNEVLRFGSLKKLYLNGCNRVEALLIEAPLLETIEAQKCLRLQKLALTTPQLLEMDLREVTNLGEIKGELPKLVYLDLRNAKSLSQKIFEAIFGSRLDQFKTLNLLGCSQLQYADLMSQFPGYHLRVYQWVSQLKGEIRLEFERLFMKDPTLQDLNLRWSQIGDSDAQALAEALKVNNTLQRLYLKSNRIGDDGAQALGEALKMNSTLQTLELEYNRISIGGGQALADALKMNSTLQELDLRGNKIGFDGGQALAEALKVNSTLQKLDLGGNQIGDGGGQAFAEALKVNSTLQTLSLGENIGVGGAQALAEALKENSTLQTLELEYNRIGDVGAQAFAEALKVNRTLQVLSLDKNRIGDGGAQALGEALKVNSTLQTLNLWGNQIGDVLLNEIYTLPKNRKAPTQVASSSSITSTSKTTELRSEEMLVFGLSTLERLAREGNDKALQGLIQEAEQGKSEAQQLRAQYALGQVYEEKKELDQAIQWYTKSALQNGCIRAVSFFSLRALERLAKEGNNEALQGLAQIAIQGNADAQYFLAEIYEEKKNLDQAIQWYTKSALQNDRSSSEELERMAKEGNEKARQGLTNAAERGNSWAQYALAQVFKEKMDLNQAIDWYTKAAERGNPEAQYALKSIQ